MTKTIHVAKLALCHEMAVALVMVMMMWESERGCSVCMCVYVCVCVDFVQDARFEVVL